MSLEQLLSDRRDDILSTFVREVERKDLPPPGIARSILVDHLPSFLDEIVQELKGGNAARLSLESFDVKAVARRHGEQRWKTGYDLQAVVREYGVLRHAILEVAKAAGVTLGIDETDLLARYLNVGVAGATAEYVRSREEQLNAQKADLEFLSSAGELLGSSLDYQTTLARLTRLLVPRLADYCVVHLEGCTIDELPIAHVDPEKIDLLRAILRHYPYPEGTHGHAQVVRTGKSLLVESPPHSFLESIAESPEHLDLLQKLGPRSWLVVPLRSKTNLLGTVTLAFSDTERHYTVSALLLAEDLARRAAAAIDNARLYDLARDERLRAEAAMRAKDEFVAMVSHELRTPLNAIVGWLRLLRGGGLPEKTREHALEVVERNANAQSQLIADLLDISRAITGKIRLEPAQVDLGNVVALVLEDARFALEAKRLELSKELPRDGMVMRGDAERLKQVVWNLLLNAIKFTPKGGMVRVGLARADSDLELTVTDSGVGMTTELIPHVFEAFRQSDSKTTRAHGGLGIGLSIAKHLVELHGGSIEARSDGLGKGSSFLVRLPVSPLISTTVGVAKVAATTLPPKELSRPPSLAGLRILVVDDEYDARDLLRTLLESCEVEVHDAANVHDALAILDTARIDIVVSDVGMPGEDGYSFIRKVRALPDKSKSSVPAVALTAFVRNEDRTRSLLEGFNVHLTKPVEPGELLIALADLAGGGRKPGG